MPRWKALPDELDPQIREFTSQLRRLVDRSGLSIASVADRTGYSKTSWERYLNGRLLAPKGAIVALAEVTGTNPLHLTTMWELAERAWSRSEMRHDMTMEAIRISQARAALGEFGGQDFGGPSAGGRSGGTRPPAAERLPRAAATSPPAGAAAPRSRRASRDRPAWPRPCRRSRRRPRSRTPPPARGVRDDGGRAVPTEVNSWGLAGYQGPSPTGGRSAGPGPGTGTRRRTGVRNPAGSPGGPGWTPGVGPARYAEPQDAVPSRACPGAGMQGRRSYGGTGGLAVAGSAAGCARQAADRDVPRGRRGRARGDRRRVLPHRRRWRRREQGQRQVALADRQQRTRTCRPA